MNPHDPGGLVPLEHLIDQHVYRGFAHALLRFPTSPNETDTIAHRFRRTFECARDRAFGGLLVGMAIKDGGGWSKSLDEKIGWLHQEALVGLLTIAAGTAVGTKLQTLAMAEHHALSAWVARKFELRPHGYSGWMVGGKRDIAFVEHGDNTVANASARKGSTPNRRIAEILRARGQSKNLDREVQ